MNKCHINPDNIICNKKKVEKCKTEAFSKQQNRLLDPTCDCAEL